MSYRIHCAECLRPPLHCYCEQIVRHKNTQPIKIIQSINEAKHPFNTGRIAQLSLSNCEIFRLNDNSGLNLWLDSLRQQHPVVAFPSSDATEISKATISENTPIILIDDTWRKAKRILFENPTLNALPKICLPNGLISEYGLRSAGKHQKNAEFKSSSPTSTLESIVYVLNVLDRSGDTFDELLTPLEWIRQRQSGASNAEPE